MKKETLDTKIKSLLYTSKGKLAAKYANLERVFIEGIWHGKTYSGSGRFCHLSNGDHLAIIEALNKLGIDYTTGNDAPRGGGIGDYVALTTKGKKQVAEWVKIRKAEIAEAKKLEVEKRQREAIEKEQKEKQYLQWCEETYTQCKKEHLPIVLDENEAKYYHNCKICGHHYSYTKNQCLKHATKFGKPNNQGFRKYCQEYIAEHYN